MPPASDTNQPKQRIGSRFSYAYRRLPNRIDRFEATLLAAGDKTLVFASPLFPKNAVIVSDQVVIEAGDMAVWCLFKGQPFDIACVYSWDGRFRGYYSDVIEPAAWSGDDVETLQLITDLFLDLWIWPDSTFAILDQDEFDLAERAGVMTAQQASLGRSTLESLTRRLQAGTFPPPEVVHFAISPADIRALSVACHGTHSESTDPHLDDSLDPLA